MKFTARDDWRPQGILDLEQSAWDALKDNESVSLTAGPGAGKTEFLAQKAAFLLQTGVCRAPSRILAISFKRDAAENLATRVKKRCAPELARRFDSMTFDSFTKGLADRFLSAIPEAWRPTKPYEIPRYKTRDIEAFLSATRTVARQDWKRGVDEIRPPEFETQVVGAMRLTRDSIIPGSADEYAVLRWWQKNLGSRPQSQLTFVMLNRLAELLLSSQPEILRALRVTYPFVFVDELQDTTYAQYDFLLSAFEGEQTTVTAVGDKKQRILGWAGALPDAFAQFSADFNANDYVLTCNYRSSPNLVRIQRVVARAIDAGVTKVESRSERLITGEASEVWSFQNSEAEALRIATWLADDMRDRGTKPRDYALLVRQTADRFETQLSVPLENAGVGLRNESRAVGKTSLQDLLVEDFTRIGVALLRLAVQSRAPEAWATATESMQRLRGIDDDDDIGCIKIEKELRTFISEICSRMQVAPSAEVATQITAAILSFLKPAALSRTFLDYGRADNLAIATEAFSLHFATSSRDASTWIDGLDAFEGVNCVPLMTVHKSKGLEYDTIIFVGLDDRMWWSHTPGNPEGIATFFVALSRAKQRAIFTFNAERGPRERIAEMYALLQEAEVPEIDCA